MSIFGNRFVYVKRDITKRLDLAFVYIQLELNSFLGARARCCVVACHAMLLRLLSLFVLFTLSRASTISFDTVQDLVNWMRPGRGGRQYGLFVGPYPVGFVPSDPNLTWIFLESPSKNTVAKKYPCLVMGLEDFFEEIQGLDLFSRGFMEIYVPGASAVLGEALRQDLSKSLISLMMLMQLHPRSRISFPLAAGLDFGMLRSLLQPYFEEIGWREDGFVEAVGRKWVRKGELIEALAAEPSSYWTMGYKCSVM